MTPPTMHPLRPHPGGPVRHLYVHIPFCHRICPYCGFYKHTPGGTDMAGFVAAVLAELDYHRTRLDLELRTIYFGGGTPSMLSPTHVSALFDGLRARIGLSGIEEWTLEANPRTFDTAKARMWKSAGVTRVSLGVQSWNPRHLATLGRDHGPDDAAAAYHSLREAGIPVVNIDQMFALPGQSLEEWDDDLTRTMSLGPDHVSTYNLTYEEDTEFLSRFKTGEFRQDGDEDAAYFRLSHDRLTGAGYDHYETSNFAAAGNPANRSRHNRAYWEGEDYLGLGPGAVSTVHGRRWTSLADTAGYIGAATRFGTAATDIEILDDPAWLTERVALELRTSDGLRRALLPPDRDRMLGYLAEEGLVVITAERVVLSDKGRLLADSVATALL